MLSNCIKRWYTWPRPQAHSQLSVFPCQKRKSGLAVRYVRYHLNDVCCGADQLQPAVWAEHSMKVQWVGLSSTDNLSTPLETILLPARANISQSSKRLCTVTVYWRNTYTCTCMYLLIHICNANSCTAVGGCKSERY